MELLNFLLALLPILWLVVALTVFKWPTFKAAIGSLVISAILAITKWQMPVMDMASAALEGFAMALWPIILVIIAAVFTYNLTLKTGAMEIDCLVLWRIYGRHGRFWNRDCDSCQYACRFGL